MFNAIMAILAATFILFIGIVINTSFSEQETRNRLYMECKLDGNPEYACYGLIKGRR